MLYRIYTESKGTEQDQNLINIVAQEFEGFTILHGTGYYKGIPESCIIFEIMALHIDHERIRRIAHCIKILNKQESVLVIRLNQSSEFI